MGPAFKGRREYKGQYPKTPLAIAYEGGSDPERNKFIVESLCMLNINSEGSAMSARSLRWPPQFGYAQEIIRIDDDHAYALACQSWKGKSQECALVAVSEKEDAAVLKAVHVADRDNLRLAVNSDGPELRLVECADDDPCWKSPTKMTADKPPYPIGVKRSEAK